MPTQANTRANALPDLRGQVALVSGASRGLGRSAALVLAEAGARVVLLARDSQALGAVAEQIREDGGRADICKADVTQPTALNAALAATLDDTGAPDIVVNCAASGLIARGASTETLSPNQMALDFETKVGGYLRVVQAVLAPMRQRRAGRIVNVGGFTLHDPQEASGFRNAAVAHLTRYLARDVAASGITVLALHPAHASNAEEVQSGANPDETGSASPALTSRHVAEAIAHVCAPWASVLNGESILLGGVRMPIMRY